LDNLGDRIREIRERLGLNQSETAMRLGLGGPAAVSKYEKNQREPEIAVLIKLSVLGNVSLDWLLTGKETVQTFAQEVPIQNIPKEQIKQWIDEFWERASDKQKAWLETEFPRAFPEYKSWLEKKLRGDEQKVGGAQSKSA